MAGDSNFYGYLGSFGLGVSAALLLVLLTPPWSHRLLSAIGPRSRHRGLVFIGVVAALSAALIAGGSRETGRATSAAASAAAMTQERSTGTAGGQQAAGSIDAATAALSARLASGQGTDADWDLLAQSYEFLGRSEDAALARQRKVAAERSLQDAVAVSAGMLGQRGGITFAAPGAVQGEVGTMLTRAEEHRRKREFKEACEIYATLASRDAMTADAWADYADAQAALAGKLAGPPARSIEAALALDPRHPKALWLKASLAHEEGRYRDAAVTWKQLLAIVPAGSSDARIVEANLSEATRLASS
jgi:cytochrome c-type biogenesis protein CcmH/NrfG